MKFKKMDDYYAESECGNYRITKTKNGFTAWRKLGKEWEGGYPHAEQRDARRECEECTIK